MTGNKIRGGCFVVPPRNDRDMIGVFYPYLEKAGKWEELKYSLRSLEKYFREDEYEVWLVGDVPEWAQNVRHIAHSKNERVYSAATYDAVMKLVAFIDHPQSPERFVRMYDDIYFIGDRTVKDLEVTRYIFTYDEYLRDGYKSGSVIWQDQVRRSMDAVKSGCKVGRGCFVIPPRNDGEIYMTETHCPEIFEKGKMREIMKRFRPAENRLLTSTLYFNVFPFERMLCDKGIERVMFYGKNEGMKELKNEGMPMQGKYFLNHNDKGLDEALKVCISEMFPVKSKWEE